MASDGRPGRRIADSLRCCACRAERPSAKVSVAESAKDNLICSDESARAETAAKPPAKASTPTLPQSPPGTPCDKYLGAGSSESTASSPGGATVTSERGSPPKTEKARGAVAVQPRGMLVAQTPPTRISQHRDTQKWSYNMGPWCAMSCYQARVPVDNFEIIQPPVPNIKSATTDQPVYLRPSISADMPSDSGTQVATFEIKDTSLVEMVCSEAEEEASGRRELLSSDGVEVSEEVQEEVVVVNGCGFEFDPKNSGLNEKDPIQDNYKKDSWLAQKAGDKKTMYCHHITKEGKFATIEAKARGLTFKTEREVWAFLGKCCHGRFGFNWKTRQLKCAEVVQKDHDNTCNKETCLFIANGLTCPTPAWALK